MLLGFSLSGLSISFLLGTSLYTNDESVLELDHPPMMQLLPLWEAPFLGFPTEVYIHLHHHFIGSKAF
jgi:hypothetical protein